MRKGLSNYVNKRSIFTAIVTGHSTYFCRGKKKRTILLKEIRNKAGRLVSNHMWIKQEDNHLPDLVPGSLITFSAKTGVYLKGYWGRKTVLSSNLAVDYELYGINLLAHGVFPTRV